MTFVLITLTVKNVRHTNELSVLAPDFINIDGSIYSRDWLVTFNHDGTCFDLALTQIELGNTMSYNLVYQGLEGLADGGVRWFDMDLYRYMLHMSLVVP